MTAKTKDDARTMWAKIVAGIKDGLSKKQDELDNAGIERKAIELTPDIVDDLRNRLCETFPAMCEGEGEAVAEVMQVIVDALAEAQPESDVDEERVSDEENDKQDEEDEEEKSEEVIKLAEQVTEMGKEYLLLIKDVSEVVDVTQKVMSNVTAQTKENNDLKARMAKIEKTVGERPRRASQAPETKLDPDSKLAKDMKQRDFSDIPDAFADMIPGGNSNG